MPLTTIRDANPCIISLFLSLHIFKYVNMLKIYQNIQFQATLVKGQERGIADALLVAKEEIRDEDGNPILDDTCIEMALTDVINGGTISI